MFRKHLMPAYRQATDEQLKILGVAAFGDYEDLVKEVYPKEWPRLRNKSGRSNDRSMPSGKLVRREIGKIVFGGGKGQHTIEHVIGKITLRLQNLEDRGLLEDWERRQDTDR